jgi:hypothetical protein
MNTTWELLEGAALSLARSGAIKDRLCEAYRNHLCLVDAAELPEGLREPFLTCHDALTRERPLPGEDAVRATVRKLSSQDAEALACQVVRLLGTWAREHAREASEPVAGAATRAKPLKAVPQVISLYPAEATRAPSRA